MNTIYNKSRRGCFSVEGLKRRGRYSKRRTNRKVYHRAAKKKARNDIEYWEYRNQE